MEPRISFITLGVADLERATRFYEQCLGLPRIETPPSVTFFELGKTWLALWPRENLAADAGLSSQGSGFPGFSLAHNVRSLPWWDRLLGTYRPDPAKSQVDMPLGLEQFRNPRELTLVGSLVLPFRGGTSAYPLGGRR